MSEGNVAARAGAPPSSPSQQLRSLLSANDELVLLSVAAQVTYFHLSGLRESSPDDRPLAEVVRIAALALAEIVPVYRDGKALNPKELDDLLIRPLSSRREQPDLDAFCIRRGDLRDALMSLRRARL